MTQQEMIDRIAVLEAEKAASVRSRPSGGLKVSTKRALSLYGEGRFPVTLYKEQWIRVLARATEIHDFIKAHDAELAAKADSIGA